MKKILFSLPLFLLGHLIYAQTDPSKGLEIFLKGDIATQQNILGLSMVEFLIVNHNDNDIKVNDMETWMFTGKVNGKTIDFSPKMGASYDYRDMGIRRHDSLHMVSNLNLFDLNFEYHRLTGSYIPTPATITVQANIKCGGAKNGSNCYSKEISIVVNPLDKTDQAVFEYLQSIKYSPNVFTETTTLGNGNVDPRIADYIISKYPESTFAELASLSQAYAETWLSTGELHKARVKQFLEKPLRSKYSFVRYLAEELNKKQ